MTNLDWRVTLKYSKNKNKSANGLRFEKWPLDLGLGVYAGSSIPDHTKFDQHLQLLIPCVVGFARCDVMGSNHLYLGRIRNCDTCETHRTRSGRTGGTGKLMLRNSEYGLYL